MTYKCPDCGREYDMPPKWCVCTPQPEQYDVFWLISADGTRELISEDKYRRFIKILGSSGKLASEDTDTELFEGNFVSSLKRADGVENTGYELVRVIDDSTLDTGSSEQEIKISLTKEEFDDFLKKAKEE